MPAELKERYRTERVYQEMKGELGLDHFEGRSFTGWHHHVSLVLCAYAFLVAERSRAVPPRPEGKVIPVRSVARPVRHFADSISTIRLTMARFLVRWLPRCPLCHHDQPARGSTGGSTAGRPTHIGSGPAPHSGHASMPIGAP